jgi:hypothetical protein
LGARAAQLDAIFQHRVQRLVRKDGTVSFRGRRFEVPYDLAGSEPWLIVDPHTHAVIGVEDKEGKPLGTATPLDMLANRHRTRHKPIPIDPPTVTAKPAKKRKPTLIDLAYAQHYGPIGQDNGDEPDTEVHHVS